MLKALVAALTASVIAHASAARAQPGATEPGGEPAATAAQPAVTDPAVVNLTQSARALASDHHCKEVLPLAARVRDLDAAYYATVFAVDPSIASCPNLAAAGPIPRRELATSAPSFVAMDRADGASRAGVELSNLFVTSAAGLNTAQQLVVYGEYMIAESGVGLYGQLPINEVTGGGQTAVGIGDAELGAMLASRGSKHVGVVVHAGITLPTAPSDGQGVIANIVGTSIRPGDLTLAIPEGVSLRAGVSPIVRYGSWFARADLGGDVNVSSAPGQPLGDSSAILHLDVGVGVVADDLAATLESVNLLAWNTDTGSASSVLDFAALSVRYTGSTVRPFVALSAPVHPSGLGYLVATVGIGFDLP